MKTLNNYITEKFKINSKTVSNQNDDYVDLGLPSGLLWSKYNYGVDENNEYGEQKMYSSAMKIKFKDGARLPTKEDFKELYDKCIVNYVKENGIEGFRFTSMKYDEESIFLPYCHIENKGQGFYWSSTEYDNIKAYILWFDKSGIKYQNINNKSNLFYIRPVLDNK